MHKVLVGTASLGLGALLLLPATGAFAVPTGAQDPHPVQVSNLSETSLRIATLATDLSREMPGELYNDLLQGSDRAAGTAADDITTVNADVVVLTGMDADAQAVDAFRENFLNNPSDGRSDVAYDYVYLPVGSKGKPSGADLNGDRIVGGAADAWGQADFEGQAAVVVLSKYPIDEQAVTSLSNFGWKDLPQSRLNDSELSGALAASIPVMSSGLWDIPIEYRGQKVHVVAAQTGESTDGYSFAAARHLDQLRVVADYLSGEDYLRDDDGKKVSGPGKDRFVLTGEFGEQASSAVGRDELLETLGKPEAINDSGNFLIPDAGWQVLGQGFIGESEPAVAQQIDGPELHADVANALIWTDVQF